ncbi:hypothetical protein [Candidatus Stoquefichus massiliensis]|uniref:hypothetical protein n=1 Tax=Candidatus Stoquefichus massiliensis TaxID=1470350 RepID=UPI00047FB161|nr:hypothetical protein [Candidatus Stoquefichus massiliensis]
MKKTIQFLLGLFLIVIMIGCKEKTVNNLDFWSATLQALDLKLENNRYVKGNWDIQVQDQSQAEDESHRSLLIRQVHTNKDIKETITYSLQNNDRKKQISYIYVKSETNQENRYDYTVELQSIDESYQSYKITYQYEKYQSGNYKDGKEANGKLMIHNDDQIQYDNVPLLKEAISAYLSLLNDFQKEFDIHYQDYDFINLPELVNRLDIPELKTVSEEASLTTDYYEQVHINAKGFQLISFLKVNKDITSAQFGTYNVEREDYESNVTVTLEKRDIENCYDIIQKNDPDVNYAVYFDKEAAYVYLQSFTDQEIKDDSVDQASKASFILKTTNPSY